MYRERIQEIFAPHDKGHKRYENQYVGKYVERPKKGTITFELTRVDIHSTLLQYDKLKQLSELLGTDKIGLAGDYELGYYDEVEMSITIVCEDVNF